MLFVENNLKLEVLGSLLIRLVQVQYEPGACFGFCSTWGTYQFASLAFPAHFLQMICLSRPDMVPLVGFPGGLEATSCQIYAQHSS